MQTPATSSIRIWPANTRARVGILCSSVGLLGVFGIPVGWVMTPLSDAPLAVVKPLMIVLSGLFVLGVTLLVHVWLKERIAQAKLLTPGAVGTDDPTQVFSNNPPAPPSGYDEVQEFDPTPAKFQHTQWIVSLFPLFWTFMVLEEILTTIRQIPSVPGGWIKAGYLVGALAIMFVVHEFIHAVVAKHFGYPVTLKHMLPVGVAVVINGAVVRRSEQLMITGAPLLVVTLGFVVFGLISDGLIVWFAFNIALYNLLASPADLYMIFILLQLSPGTLLYHPCTDDPIGVYEPAESSPSVLTRLEQQVTAIIGPTK